VALNAILLGKDAKANQNEGGIVNYGTRYALAYSQCLPLAVIIDQEAQIQDVQREKDPIDESCSTLANVEDHYAHDDEVCR
jgi:hypothetical protein